MAMAIIGTSLVVAAEEPQFFSERALGPNDFSYYRFFGKGETFGIAIADVTTNVESRAKFWKRVEEAKVPIIWQLTFKRTKEWKLPLPKTSKEAIERLDAFLAPDEGVTPCPEKIFAVTPAEENVTWDGQLAVQDAIAKHLKDKYGVKTYQWLTEPLRPTLAIQADGWVFDAYSVTDPATFYAHIESFILTGLPVVPCLWASGKWGGWFKEKTWDDLTRYTVERMDMCRSLNLPVLVFAVAGKGSVGHWFSPTVNPGERYYRETIRHYLDAVPSLPEASWKPRENIWPARATEDGRVTARVNLKSFYLTDSTTFDNVRNWRLEKAGLALLGGHGTLSWRFRSEGIIRKGVFSLRHSKGARGSFCGVPLAADGLTRVESGNFRSKLIVLAAESPLNLEELSFEGEGEGGLQEVELQMDTSYGRTDYTAKVVLGDEGGLGGINGRAATRRIVRHVPLPGHVNGRLMIEADVLADAKNYAGAVTMSVLAEKGEVLATVASDPAKDARQTLRLTDDPPDTPVFKQGFALPYGTQVVDIVFDLRVGCGIETSGKNGAKVFSATLKYRPLHP
ncbi:MAG: hypothetical protein IJQ73_03615 [Kiritimatiellae bacterium]|nr:hypothetical protein [Kiritimatiellia bacterium]